MEKKFKFMQPVKLTNDFNLQRRKHFKQEDDKLDLVSNEDLIESNNLRFVEYEPYGGNKTCRITGERATNRSQENNMADISGFLIPVSAIKPSSIKTRRLDIKDLHNIAKGNSRNTDEWGRSAVDVLLNELANRKIKQP